ncbi:MAG TPA: DUF5666 domain-containing protein [Pyrinomonadaceae bacterium]
MKKLCIVSALVLFALSLSANAQTSAPHAPPTAPQKSDPGITPNLVLGDVVATDTAGKQIVLKTDAGSVVIVTVADNTIIRKNPPGETKLDKAVPMTFAEIGVGDRVLARGKPADDGKSIPARALIVNTKAELTAKQEAERAEWKRRGVVGTVTAVNAAAGEITLTTGRTPEGPQTAVVVAGQATKFRRYAPDSVKFADAKSSTFEELKAGDQLRAKGEKSEDGKRLTAEEIVSGSFRTILGTVTAVDAAKNEITVKSSQGGQDVSVVISRDSMLKRFPDMGAMGGGGMVRMQAGPGGAPAGGGAQHGGARPEGATQGGGPQRRMMGGPDAMQEMLERLPATTVAEVKPGQMIVFSTTGVDPTRVTAIQLIAGVEPLVAMMQARGGRVSGGGPGGAGMGGGDGGMGFGFGIGQP